MPIELQNTLVIAGALVIWAAIDYVIVKFIDWRKSKQPKPRGATAL